MSGSVSKSVREEGEGCAEIDATTTSWLGFVVRNTCGHFSHGGHQEGMKREKKKDCKTLMLLDDD